MPLNDVSTDQSQCVAHISNRSHPGSDDLFMLLLPMWLVWRYLYLGRWQYNVRSWDCVPQITWQSEDDYTPHLRSWPSIPVNTKHLYNKCFVFTGIIATQHQCVVFAGQCYFCGGGGGAGSVVKAACLEGRRSRARTHSTFKMVNQNRMIFDDFSVNSEPISLTFYKGHLLLKSEQRQNDM